MIYTKSEAYVVDTAIINCVQVPGLQVPHWNGYVSGLLFHSLPPCPPTWRALDQE